MFRAIRIFAGLDKSSNANQAVQDETSAVCVQECLIWCIESAPLTDELFMQLVRMTTPASHSKADEGYIICVWKMFW